MHISNVQDLWHLQLLLRVSQMTCRALLDFPGQHDFNSR